MQWTIESVLRRSERQFEDFIAGRCVASGDERLPKIAILVVSFEMR